MTDKQIIIDGVDVQNCDFFEYCDVDVEFSKCLAHWHTNEDYSDVYYAHCDAYPNCYYKQLKRKEQECEELKNFHINLVGVKECEIKELVKYKQTLDEIKKIANKFDYWNSNLSQTSEILHEIIEKISEVEDE